MESPAPTKKRTAVDWALLVAVVLVPLWTWLFLRSRPGSDRPVELYSGGVTEAASELPFEMEAVVPDPPGLPLITNVQVLDFDGDGRNEVVACDAGRQAVLLHRRTQDGWTTETLLRDVNAPAHATCFDIDGDGDRDVVVAVLGNLLPDDSIVGRVELFVNEGDRFERHVILDDVRRVADVQPGDFDGDGDVDLAVAVFGYARGEVLWLENHGDHIFEDHRLHVAPGAIHVPVADYDGDGDLDIATVVSQDEEELWLFENDGSGSFEGRMVWMTVNYDLGSAGLVASDLDRDGDIDLVLPVGDNLEDFDAHPQPYHGCLWFENRGGLEFASHRIATLPGTYAADVADLDGDDDLDVVVCVMTNDWRTPGTASLVWLENDGEQSFTPWQIASEPIHLVTVATGDVDGDGGADVVAGSLNFRAPYDRIGAVTAWLNRRTPAGDGP